MKTVKVTQLKARLSEYLRMASRGSRIIVQDRDEPIAQLGPLDATPLPWRERLVRDGRLRRGSQNWGALPLSVLGRAIDIQSSLAAIREEPRRPTPRK